MLGIGVGLAVLAWPSISALGLLYVIAGYAIAFGVIAIAGAFWLPIAAGDAVLLSLSGLVSVLFGLATFAKPGDGALVLLALIAAFSLVKGSHRAGGGDRRGSHHEARVHHPHRGDRIDPSRHVRAAGSRTQEADDVRSHTHIRTAPQAAGRRGAGESTLDRAKPIALGLILAVLAVAGLRVLAQLEHVLILVFLAVLVASAVSRPAAALERRGVPRGGAVAVVQLAATVFMMALGVDRGAAARQPAAPVRARRSELRHPVPPAPQ